MHPTNLHLIGEINFSTMLIMSIQTRNLEIFIWMK
jgi:hypothetical protein